MLTTLTSISSNKMNHRIKYNTKEIDGKTIFSHSYTTGKIAENQCGGVYFCVYSTAF